LVFGAGSHGTPYTWDPLHRGPNAERRCHYRRGVPFARDSFEQHTSPWLLALSFCFRKFPRFIAFGCTRHPPGSGSQGAVAPISRDRGPLPAGRPAVVLQRLGPPRHRRRPPGAFPPFPGHAPPLYGTADGPFDPPLKSLLGGGVFRGGGGVFPLKMSMTSKGSKKPFLGFRPSS